MDPTGPGAGRLSRDPGGRPVRVAMSADRDAFMARFLAALRTGAPRSTPFAIAGSMEVRWDGTSCTIVDQPQAAGLVEVTLVNTTQGDVALLLGGAAAPKTWPDVVTFVQQADLADPNLKAPDWIVQVPVDLRRAGTRSTAFADPAESASGATGTYPTSRSTTGPFRGGDITRPPASDLRLELAGCSVSANGVGAAVASPPSSPPRGAGRRGCPVSASGAARRSGGGERASRRDRRVQFMAAASTEPAHSRPIGAGSGSSRRFRAPRQRVARRVEVASLPRHQAEQPQRGADCPRIVVGRADLEGPRGE
jgi:hypothetical protein